MSSGLVHRVTDPRPTTSLEQYIQRRGGTGLSTAGDLDPAEILAVVDASGLRGRGGAGFPTGKKWRTVAEFRSAELPTAVVVNAAEGEPGTYKDRHILRTNPYQVIEGALIAARAVGASSVVIGLKGKETDAQAAVHRAIDEMVEAGWAGDVSIRVADGPDEYLFGEETALLEVIDGRFPFPRIAPPWRRGVIEVTDGDVADASNLSAHVEMAGATDAPPALVNNAETMANVAHILARGADWFRTEGTDQSPGTFVVTVTGATVRAGVGEVVAGTTLRHALELIGGGPGAGRSIKAVLSGVSNKVITADLLDTPLTYEAMQPLGIGPGSGGFIVFDDTADMVAVAAGVARFLAIESCGQCSPCKQDGLTIADRLAALAANDASEDDLALIIERLASVADGARCFLASQQQTTALSIIEAFPDELAAHVAKTAPSVPPALIAELASIDDEVAVWDERHRDKQPDWTYDATWAGRTPADRYRDHLLESEDL